MFNNSKNYDTKTKIKIFSVYSIIPIIIGILNLLNHLTGVNTTQWSTLITSILLIISGCLYSTECINSKLLTKTVVPLFKLIMTINILVLSTIIFFTNYSLLETTLSLLYVMYGILISLNGGRLYHV